MTRTITLMPVGKFFDLCEETKNVTEADNCIELTDNYPDAESALISLSRAKPDAVIFDLILPNMDGISFLKKARMLYPDIKYIAVSPISDESIIQYILDCGADCHIKTPCESENILSKVIALFKTSSLPEREHSSSDFDLETHITNIIKNIGIPSNIKGFYYMRDAIRIGIEMSVPAACIHKYIYSAIAKKYCISLPNIDRAIRYAISIAWERGNTEYIGSILGHGCSCYRPTNSELITAISDKIKLERKACIA